jgi:hypothetical protein
MSELLPGLTDALEEMNRGNVEAAVALLDANVDWRGRANGHLWWKQTSSGHGPGEARENFELEVVKGRARPGTKEFALEEVDQVGDRLVVGGRWTMEDGSRENRRTVLPSADRARGADRGHAGLHESARRAALIQ